MFCKCTQAWSPKVVAIAVNMCVVVCNRLCTSRNETCRNRSHSCSSSDSHVTCMCACKARAIVDSNWEKHTTSWQSPEPFRCKWHPSASAPRRKPRVSSKCCRLRSQRPARTPSSAKVHHRTRLRKMRTVRSDVCDTHDMCKIADVYRV